MYNKLNKYVGHSAVVASIHCVSGFYDYTHYTMTFITNLKKNTYEQTQNAVSQQ